MHRWSDPAETPQALRPCVATFGNFDGVHRGHQAVLAELVATGRELRLPAVAVTFQPHPVAVIHPERAQQLISPGPLRDELLEETGIDGLLVLHFTREFADQTPEEFVRRTFVDTLAARVLVVGQDTRGFGRGYTGDVPLLRELGEKYRFRVLTLHDMGDSERWSSSAVRGHLAHGEVADAARILGRPHRVRGVVVHGHHRGRDLGYPTANLGRDAQGLVPADGVYAGWLTRNALAPGAVDRRLPAAISVGTNPTFGDLVRSVEAYVLDRTDLELYDEPVTVEFVERIRPTLRFDTIEDLLAAMADDVARCRQVLGTPVHP